MREFLVLLLFLVHFVTIIGLLQFMFAYPYHKSSPYSGPSKYIQIFNKRAFLQEEGMPLQINKKH